MVCRSSWNRLPLNKEDINRPEKKISNGPHKRTDIVIQTWVYSPWCATYQSIQVIFFASGCEFFFFLPFLNFTSHGTTTHARRHTHRCPVFHRSGGKQALYNEFMAGWWHLLVENTLFICESKGELKQFGCLLTSPEHIQRTRFSCWSVVIFSFHCLQAV